MYFEHVLAQNSKKLAKITYFLQQNELTLDTQIEQFVVAFDEQG